MKAANVKISLLEKQLYIEKEKMEEFQQEMKDQIVSLEKKVGAWRLFWARQRCQNGHGRMY